MSNQNRQNILEKITKTQKIIDRIDQDSSKLKSKDEAYALLENIKNNLIDLEKVINNSLSLDKVTDEDFRKIHVLEKKVVQDAMAKAYEDGIVTKDEKVIIQQLFDDIENLSATFSS